jgi:hypothetical protein
MLGSYQRWEQEGEAWKAILDRIERAADELVRKLAVEVVRGRWDAPEITLQWYADDDIGKAIQVLITGSPGAYELRISVSAWKDLEPIHVRQWRSEEDIVEPMPVPTNPTQLDIDELSRLLRKAYTIVYQLTEEDLNQKDALPSLPPNLTGKFVKGQYVV